MKQDAQITLLDNTPLFKGVDVSLLFQDPNGYFITEFTAGEEIYSPKNRQKHLGLILSGTASVFSADENAGVLLRLLEKGDTFGVATLFSKRESFVSLILAKKPCRVLFFKEETISDLLKNDAAFCMNYVRFLSDRICFLNTKISCFTAGSPERRLAFFLLAFDETESSQYTVSTSANSLSDMLNVGRASLYRAFEKMEADNLIKRNGKQITILDKNILKQRFC